MTAMGHWQIDAFGIGAGERLIFAYFILKRDDVPFLHMAEDSGPAVQRAS